jgi:4-methylaminobutanoate oxidase (formaldehyde-forming)
LAGGTVTTNLPPHASIVVIGGGIMGCSVAYHLAKLGCRDVVLLERHKLTSGTTWHSAAQVRQLRSTRNLTELIQYSTELYATLEAETGQATGWTRTGSLSIATNPDRLTHIRRQAALARAFGVEAHEISPREARELWPMMNGKDVIGAVFSPHDGRVNPSDLCAALVKGARAGGARVFEGVSVSGFVVEDGRVAGVETALDRIACETVVNCAGLWGRQVAALAGVAAPLYACEHFYLLTKPIEGVTPHLPTLSDHDGHLYIRDEVGGLLVGCFEPWGKPLPLAALPADFAFDLLNEDWDHFEPMMVNALHRIPALETAEVRMLLNGPESFTPDGLFLLGEAPELRGFFLGCGMNSVGIATGGGAGRALAEWIVEGRPTMDLWPVDIRRFAPFHNNLRTLAARIPEELGLHYAIAYPGREPTTARDLRQSPLHDRLAAKGARFGTRMGWERPSYFVPPGQTVSHPLTFGRPAWFDCVGAEHRAAREAVAIFDQSSFGKLRVEGRDAERLLQRLCANDLAVPPGKAVYTAMLNEQGGIESDLTVMRLAEAAFLLVTGTAQPCRDADWIRRHIDGERVALSDVTSTTAVLGVMGPRSRALLQGLTSADFSNEAFPYFTWQAIDLGHATVRAARLSYVGELGWELYVPSDCAAYVYDLIAEAGAEHGLVDAGSYALTSLRVEKAYRAWGHDIGPEDTPLEAGLGFALRLNKGAPFIGRAAVLAQRDLGPKRRLVVFTLRDPEALPLGDEPILRGGTIVGQVTSAAFGHSLGRSVALGYVRPPEGTAVEDALAGGGFELDIAGRRFAADASLRPPWDPQGRRPRS